MTMSVLTLLSEEEFLNLPESAGKQELLEGELIDLPPAKYSHDELAKRIASLLETAVPRSRVWVETAYRLSSRSWLKPDVSVSWPEQRIEDDWQQGSPLLAVEVASRGNTPEQLEKKRVLYLGHGAAEVWIIYPKTRTMLVSRRDSSTHIEAGVDYRCDQIGITVTPEYRTPVR
jgi:Uma2 family endonuclease